MSTSSPRLPDGWRWSTLAELADVVGGLAKGKKRPAKSRLRSVPYLRVANVQRGHIDLTEVKTIEATENEVQDLRLLPGDVLLNEGGDRDKLGRGWVWKGQLPECIHQNHVFRARVREAALLPELLSHYANSAGQHYFTAQGKQTTNLASISLGRLRGLPVPVPPVDQQAALLSTIDAHFSRLDAATATLERVQRNLERYRASVLKAAVEGRLVPTEAELAKKEGRSYEPASVLLKRILAERRRRWEEAELAKLKAKGKAPTDDRWKAKYEEPAAPDTDGLPQLPEGWCWATSEALFWDAGYGTSGKCTPEASGPPVLRIPNVQDQTLDLSDLKFAVDPGTLAPDGAVEPGDFLFIRTNGSVNLIGRGAVILDAPPRECFFASYLIRLRLPRVECLWRWFAFAWHTSVVRNQLVRDAASSAGQHNVSLSAASKYLVPLPPAREQERILATVDRLETGRASASDDTRVGHDRIARLRQSILKWAFDGRLAESEAP